MRSTAKYVVIVRHHAVKGHATYPVSVHANARTASIHRAALSAAVKGGDASLVKELAPAFKLAEDGSLPVDVKYAIVALPYEPEAPAGAVEDDSFEF